MKFLNFLSRMFLILCIAISTNLMANTYFFKNETSADIVISVTYGDALQTSKIISRGATDKIEIPSALRRANIVSNNNEIGGTFVDNSSGWMPAQYSLKIFEYDCQCTKSEPRICKKCLNYMKP